MSGGARSRDPERPVDGGKETAPFPFLAAPIFAASAAAALTAFGHTLWTWHAEPAARIRDVLVLHQARELFELFDVNLLVRLPSALHRPIELDGLSGFLALLGASCLVHLVVFLIVGLALAPVLLLVHRAAGPGRLGSTYRRLLPIFVLVFFLLPGSLAILHRQLNRGGSPLPSVAMALGASAVVLALSAPLFRDPLQNVRLLRSLGRAGLAFTALSAVAALPKCLPAFSMRQQPPVAQAHAPNILLVSIDSLRADHVHSYGYPRPTSPTIDRLASEGALFRNVVSSSSWTLPAHVSLLTSLPSVFHGVVDSDTRMLAETKTLAEVLYDAGYDTTGFVCGVFLDGRYGFYRGFRHYDDFTIVRAREYETFTGITSPRLIRLAESWLTDWSRAKRRRPFFLFLHMWDVHYDYTPPPPYDRAFDPEYQGTITGENIELGSAVHPGMDPRDLQHVVALYDGEILFTDEYLGRLIRFLEDLEVLDHTVVVVTADHGEEFFEHGMKGHGKQLYDETVKVPLILRYPPTVPPGTEVSAQVQLIDVAPTILSLARLRSPSSFGLPPDWKGRRGFDLTPLLRDKAALPPLPAFSDLYGKIGSIRKNGYKYIAEDGVRPGKLFDLERDPLELDDLQAVEPERAVDLAEALAKWRARAPARQGESNAIELTEDTKKRLRALGYLQ